MKKFIKWFLFLTIALFCGLAIVIYNPGLIKGPLERNLSRMAGYSISLKGDLKIRPGRLTELTADHVHISAPDWSAHQDLIAVEHLRLSLLTSSLFEDIIVLDFLQIDKLELNLETNADGKGNWLTANKPKSKSKSDTDSPSVIFKTIAVSDTSARFLNGKTGVENVLNIATLNKHELPDGMLHTRIDGDLNNRLVEATITMGPYANLARGQNIDFTVDGHFGELKIVGSGLVDDLLKPQQPKFDIDFKGPNIDEITAMLGIEDLGGGEFSLRTRAGLVDGSYEAAVNGTIGDISLNFAAQTSDLSELDVLDLNMAINGPSLGAFTRVFGIEHWPDKPFSLKGSAERVGRTMNVRDLTLNIGGTRLLLDALFTDFPTLEDSRVKLLITGDDVTQFHELLGIKAIATGAFSVNAKLDVSADGVEIVQVDLDTSLGQVKLSGTLGSPPNYIGSKLQLHLDSHNAHSLISILGIDALPDQAFNLNTRFELVENGVRIERGVLVTIRDERLELGGFVAFSPGIKGSDVDFRFSGQNLAQVLGSLAGKFVVPDRPYNLEGRVQVLDSGVQLDKVEAGFEGIKLATNGLIGFGNKKTDTDLAFQLSGENLSSLRSFEVIGESLNVFVPGQPYQAGGRFKIEENGWKLDGIEGQVGETTIRFDSLISKKAGLIGTNVDFSIKGPALNSLLAEVGEAGLPPGPFASTGQLKLSDQALSIKNFSFESEKAHGKVDLEFGWPFSNTVDIGFNASIWGDDIRYLLPKIGPFQPDMAVYKVNAVGNKRGDLLSMKEFDANIGNLQILLKGEMDNNSTADIVDIAFSASSKDISKLGRLNEDQLPPLPLDIKADFKGNARQFVVRDLVASLGESRLNGELDVSLNGPKPNIKLTATSDYIDIRPFLSPREPNDETTATTKPDRLIPATPIPLKTLAANDLSIKLNIGELRYLQDSITGLRVDLEQQAGSLNISEIFYEAPQGTFRAALSINPTNANKADVKLDLSAEKFVFNYSGLAEEKLDQVPSFDIDFHASGNGSNLREVAGSMNGSFYLGSQGGNAENVDLSILDTFIIDQISTAMMPKTDEELDDTQFSCIAANLEISDGLVKTNPAFAFTSEKIAVVTKGTLDLKTEKMNFNFNSTPTNALQINPGEMFYPYILISGTLVNPVVGVDPGKAVLHGGAAIATLGISVLAKGVVDRLGNAIPVCQEMLSKAPTKN